MQNSYTRFLGALFLAGAASGIVATLPLNFGLVSRVLPFAVAVTSVFGYFRRIRSVARGLVLFIACALTLAAAIRLTLQIADVAMSSWGYDLLAGRGPILAVAICGYIGQFLILIAAAIATSNPGWRALARALGWSLAGAAMGAAAAIAVDWLPPDARWPGAGLVFMVWQPSAALVMGLFVGRRPAAAP
jgi:hypothetical protein